MLVFLCFILFLLFVYFFVIVFFYCMTFFFFFKQKTAYEMRIIDWSADVCSPDLVRSFSASSYPKQAPCQRRKSGIRRAGLMVNCKLIRQVKASGGFGGVGGGYLLLRHPGLDPGSTTARKTMDPGSGPG